MMVMMFVIEMMVVVRLALSESHCRRHLVDRPGEMLEVLLGMCRSDLQRRSAEGSS